MVREVSRKIGRLVSTLLFASSLLTAQQPAPPLNVSGHIDVAGRSTPYLIRHLPVSSFPDLPEALTALLNLRNCLIPQTFAAHHPENVIHASLERTGSSDWAVLCSSEGTVSLLVFFSSAPASLLVLSSASETERLQVHDATGVLGFNWGIDPASPEKIHQAQSGLVRRPARVDHDALADSVVDGRTVYRFFVKNVWIKLDMPVD